MKKFFKRSISVFLIMAMLFSMLVTAYASNRVSELGVGENEIVLSDEEIYEDNSYTRVVTSYDSISDTYYSRVESDEYFVVTEKTNDQVIITTYQKNASRAAEGYELLYSHCIDMREDTTEKESRARKHYESSTFLIDDSYTYYPELSIWILYCSGEWTRSGDNPSKTILNYCEKFKTNLLAMDDAGTELMEILLTLHTSANIAISIKNVVIAFSEDGFGSGILELAKDSLLGLLGVYCPGFSFASVAYSAAKQGLEMGEYHDKYVSAFNSVKRLVD